MKKGSISNIFSLFFNFAVIGLVAYAVPTYVATEGFLKFPVIAVLVLALACLINVPFNIIGIFKQSRLPKTALVFKLMGVVTVTMNIVLGALLSIYQATGLLETGYQFIDTFGRFSDVDGLFIGLIIPLLGIISFIFVDKFLKIRFPGCLLGAIPTILYLGFYYLNNQAQLVLVDGVTDWHHLFNENVITTIMFFALMVIALLIAMLYVFFNKLVNIKYLRSLKQEQSQPVEQVQEQNNEPVQEEENPSFNEELDDEPEEEPAKQPQEVEDEEEQDNEPVEDEVQEPVEESPIEEKKPVEKKPAAKKPAAKKAAPAKKEAPKKATPKATPKPAEAPKDTGTKVYHLTKRKEDGMWAITFVGGQKAVKLFKTKKEAEEYLATLTKNQGATALIRNSKGAKAGKFASSIKSDEDK